MPNKKTPGPSVKDDDLYEKLRSEGNSKGKSARKELIEALRNS